MQSEMSLGGAVTARVIPVRKAPLAWQIKNKTRPAYWLGWAANQAALGLTAVTGIPTLTSELDVRHFAADGMVTDYGTVSYRVVTTAFVNFLVDQLQTETSVFGDFKYHDSGEGTTGAAVGDTDMESADGESRATGTQTEGASANIYKSVGTISYTSTLAITEHGLFNTTATATLLDRHTFSAINVGDGDSIKLGGLAA